MFSCHHIDIWERVENSWVRPKEFSYKYNKYWYRGNLETNHATIAWSEKCVECCSNEIDRVNLPKQLEHYQGRGDYQQSLWKQHWEVKKLPYCYILTKPQQKDHLEVVVESIHRQKPSLWLALEPWAWLSSKYYSWDQWGDEKWEPIQDDHHCARKKDWIILSHGTSGKKNVSGWNQFMLLPQAILARRWNSNGKKILWYHITRREWKREKTHSHSIGLN